MLEDVGTVRLGRSIESREPLLFQRSGETIEDFVAVMNGWAANPAEMDYWIPASSVCLTIDAVAKWRFTSESVDSSATGPTVERFCLLQMTKAIKHKCDETILWNFAKPFLEKRKQVCFMVLLWDDRFEVPEGAGVKKRKFRLDPVEMKTDEVKTGVPVYVAESQMLDSQQ